MPRTGLPRLMAGKADKPKLRIRGDMGKEPRRFQQSRNAGSAFVGAGALGGRIMVCRYDQDVRLFVRGLPYGGYVGPPALFAPRILLECKILRRYMIAITFQKLPDIQNGFLLVFAAGGTGGGGQNLQFFLQIKRVPFFQHGGFLRRFPARRGFPGQDPGRRAGTAARQKAGRQSHSQGHCPHGMTGNIHRPLLAWPKSHSVLIYIDSGIAAIYISDVTKIS